MMAMATSFVIAALLVAVGAFYAFHLIPIAKLSESVRDNLNKLQDAEVKFLNEVMGPESLAFDSQGRGPYTGIADGRILRWEAPDRGWMEFATVYRKESELCKPTVPPSVNLTYEHICGRPLGLRFKHDTGELFIADPYFGLLVVGPEGGEARVVVNEAEGVPFGFTNDLVIASDGTIYFTDSSSHYQRRKFVLVILSGDDSGRLMSYNPSTKETKVLCRGLRFPNGVALSKDESFLVMSETTSGRLLRFWLKGKKSGALEPFAELPGLPDNVRANEKGEFWVAIHCRHSRLTSNLLSKPWLIKPISKLPFSMNFLYRVFLVQVQHAMALHYDADGNLLEVLEDQTGKVVKSISEVEERDGKLWMGSVLMPYIAVYSR